MYLFLKTLLFNFESAAEAKGIQLHFHYGLSEHLQVKLDEDKVEKIIINYMTNALKFTPKQGKITFNVTQNVGEILMSVEDTGIGILPSDLTKIFDRFYQTQKGSQQEGVGIGLSLCREFAKVMDGRVWATSEIGKGSIFYLELPLVETFALKKEREEENKSISIAQLSNKAEDSISNTFRPSILVVEDNLDLRQFLVMILKNNYNVEAVENGQEAWKRLANNLKKPFGEMTAVPPSTTVQPNHRLPSIIISDIMMPVMGGIELVTKIKTNKKLQHIPIILLTARQSLAIKIEALRIGVDDYITKPFKETELIARVANLIKNSQARMALIGNEGSEKKPPKVVSDTDLVWLKKLEQIFIANIGNTDFKISDAASQMEISPRRLQQKIRQITGLTAKKYQRTILLNSARSLLKSENIDTVSEVMQKIGFYNRDYFTKIYLEEFGVKPIDELK